MQPAELVFQPNEALLEAVQRAQGAQIAGQAQQQARGFEQSIADIAAEQQARGVDFQGFSPAEQARLFGAARSGLESQQAQAGLMGTQLAGTLAGMQTARTQAGVGFDDEERRRQQQARLEREGMSTDLDIARQRADTQIQASQIREAQRQAEEQRRLQERMFEQQRETFNELLESRQGPDRYVSPTTYDDMRALWIEQGGTGGEFDQMFMARFANPDHLDDYTPEGFEELQRRQRIERFRDIQRQEAQPTVGSRLLSILERVTGR